MNKKAKQEAIKAMSDQALQTILANQSEQERAEPGDPRYPLAGLVHISGIGQVPMSVLKAEAERRAA